jgi:prepilin-type N-terminal cleavage/methylation domain-containing protein
MRLTLSSQFHSQTLGGIPSAALFLLNAISLPSRFLSGSTARKSREPSGSSKFRANGFTLVELSVVIAVILVLVGAASLGIKPYYAYRDGRTAGEMLRSVKAAQLMFLADHPSTLVSSLTADNSPTTGLLPYMPNGVWPTLPSLNGAVPTISCTVFPPVISVADPSGSTTDGLWDVGKY